MGQNMGQGVDPDVNIITSFLGLVALGWVLIPFDPHTTIASTLGGVGGVISYNFIFLPPYTTLISFSRGFLESASPPQPCMIKALVHQVFCGGGTIVFSLHLYPTLSTHFGLNSFSGIKYSVAPRTILVFLGGEG